MTSSSSSSPEVSAATSTDPQDHFSYKHATHEEVLEDLSSRFILNLPDEELASLERICFQVEQAHWFYEDFIREENPKFPSLPLKKFSAMLFHACPLLHHWSHDHEQAFNTFMQYKTRVPVCGAIMLNDTWEKCVLVKGWKSSSGWGFPKGKINEVELPVNCAVREVLEETGYNLAGQIDPQNVIEMSIKEQKISLFIVPGVPEDYEFKTKTRKEISKIEWFRLTDLPTWKKNKTAPGRYYLISPFIGALKAFINERKPRTGPRRVPKTKRPPPNQTPLLRKSNTKYASYDDATHESSSQSSSAENGEPHTPSPHYTEPLEKGISRITSDELTKEDLSWNTMDPHFASLLSSLAMSASMPPPPDTNDNEKRVVIADPPGIKKQDTPIPVTKLSSDPSMPLNYDDWSITTPNPASSSRNEAPTPSLGLTTSPSQLPIKLRSNHQTPKTTSGRPLADIERNGSQDPLYPASPSIVVVSSPTNTVVSPRSMESRRTSSIADISPYLSRPPENPVSTKMLKHLALLEAVADESARMSPFLAHTSSSNIGVDHNARYSVPPNLAPLPVLPSPTTPHHTSDPRVIYASRPIIQPTAARGVSHVPGDNFNMPNSYQTRSKTSHAYHRGNLGSPPGSLSMNQSQLSALISGPHTAQTQAYSQPPHVRGTSYPPLYSPILSSTYPTTSLSNSFSYPTPSLPYMAPTSFPAPSTSPGIYGPLRKVPHPGSGSLLSILNNNRGGPHKIMTSPQAALNRRSS